MTNPPAIDAGELARLTAELKRLAEAAIKVAPAPWHHDTVHCEGDYGGGPAPGHGFDAYQVLTYTDGKWQAIVDTLNSDLTIVHEESDEDGQKNAWDETARITTAYIAAANPHVILQLAAFIEAVVAEHDQLAASLADYQSGLADAREQFAAREAVLVGALRQSEKVIEQWARPQTTIIAVTAIHQIHKIIDAALANISPRAEAIHAVVEAFGPFDDKDWDRLFQHDIADSGHGRFLKGVLLKVRDALSRLATTEI